MIDDETVKAIPCRCGKITSLLTQRVIASITSQDLDLLWIVTAEFLQRLFTTSYNHKVTWLTKEVMRNCQPDAYPRQS